PSRPRTAAPAAAWPNCGSSWMFPLACCRGGAEPTLCPAEISITERSMFTLSWLRPPDFDQRDAPGVGHRRPVCIADRDVRSRDAGGSRLLHPVGAAARVVLERDDLAGTGRHHLGS